VPGVRQALSRWVFSPLQGVLHRDWTRLLREAGFHVDPAYRLRGLVTGMASRANTRNARREEARYEGELHSLPVKPPLFVLGHYRSGTTYLHNLLCRDPRLGFCSYYQATFPHTFLTTEASGRRLGFLSPTRRPFDQVRVGVDEPAEDELALCSMTFLSPHMGWHFPAQWRRFRRYLTLEDVGDADRQRWKGALLSFARKLTLRHRRPLVLKSPGHTARVRLLLEAFPDARFVHIHRDPFEVFQSTRHMESRVRPLFRYQAIEPPEEPDGLILDRLRSMYAAYLRDRPRIPAGRLVEIPYADLVQEPLQTLERVYDGLDLPGFDRGREPMRRYVESLRGFTPNRHRPLGSTIRGKIRRAWRPYFEAFGYAGADGRGQGRCTSGIVARSGARG
jgi:hypothetical protein